MNRTLMEKTRSTQEDSKIKRIWGHAIQTAAFLVNRSPLNALHSIVTPFELWDFQKPNVKSWIQIFVTYTHNGCRVWDPVARKTVHARDVDCIESDTVEQCKSRTDGFVKIPVIR